MPSPIESSLKPRDVEVLVRNAVAVAGLVARDRTGTPETG